MTTLADAFWIGFLVPNLFRRLFGEGALTAAFIPVYTDWRHKDPVIARRLASLCVGLLLVVLSGGDTVRRSGVGVAGRPSHGLPTPTWRYG